MELTAEGRRLAAEQALAPAVAQRLLDAMSSYERAAHLAALARRLNRDPIELLVMCHTFAVCVTPRVR